MVTGKSNQSNLSTGKSSKCRKVRSTACAAVSIGFSVSKLSYRLYYGGIVSIPPLMVSHKARPYLHPKDARHFEPT